MTSFFEKTNYKPRENSGSRSSNRFMIQVSFAIHQMINSKNDYLIILDIIDDVAIINNINAQEKITTFQIKTTDNKHGYYEFSRLISDKVFQKIYDHIEQLQKDSIDKLYLISNQPIRHVLKKNTYEFIEGDVHLKKSVVAQNILDNINQNKKIQITDVPDSIYFNHWDIKLINHEDIIKAEFRTFLEDINSNLSLGVSSALYSSIRDILTRKQNYEFKLDEDINDVIPHKSFSKKSFYDLIHRANTVEELHFKDIEIKYLKSSNLSEKRNYKLAFASIKAILYSFSNYANDELVNITHKIENDFQNELNVMTSENQFFEFLQENLVKSIHFNEFEFKILIILAIENYLN